MIELDPPKIAANCPHCFAPLVATGWYMPGMRALARSRCDGCAFDFYVDLPIGQAIYSPMILELPGGTVHDAHAVPWFAEWLRRGYRDRTDRMPALTIERHRAIERPVILLNCLDAVYGHALLKLFNAQAWLDSNQYDVVILAHRKLASLIPDGVAESWLVDLEFQHGALWSDGLADAIARECVRFSQLFLAPVHSHPHPSRVNIERFSRVDPFPLEKWAQTRPPTVTFIWRDDRLWNPRPKLLPFVRSSRSRQRSTVVRLFATLRRQIPNLDIAVAGFGAAGGLPHWIADLRTPDPDVAAEQSWLARYAASHLVVGVQGSNMILPTAHAGSALEILDDSRRDNFLQDVMLNGSDPRDLMFRYRFFEPGVKPEVLAMAAAQIISRYPDFNNLMSLETTSEFGPVDVRD